MPGEDSSCLRLEDKSRYDDVMGGAFGSTSAALRPFGDSLWCPTLQSPLSSA